MAVRNRLIDLISEKQKRLQRRLEIKEIADATGVSRQAIYKWLNNDAESLYLKTVDAFCKYFECQVGDLLIYEPDDEPGEREPA